MTTLARTPASFDINGEIDKCLVEIAVEKKTREQSRENDKLLQEAKNREMGQQICESLAEIQAILSGCEKELRPRLKQFIITLPPERKIKIWAESWYPPAIKLWSRNVDSSTEGAIFLALGHSELLFCLCSRPSLREGDEGRVWRALTKLDLDNPSMLEKLLSALQIFQSPGGLALAIAQEMSK